MWLKPHVLFNVCIFSLGNFFIPHFFICRPRWLGKNKRIPVKDCFGILFRLKDTVAGKNTFNFCNQKQLQETLHFFWFVTLESILCANLCSNSVCKESSFQKETNKTLIERQWHFKFIATFWLSNYKGFTSS